MNSVYWMGGACPLRLLISTMVLSASLGCSASSTVAEETVPADVTQWAPEGARTVGTYDYEVMPEPNAFHTMHADTNNTDSVWVALAPALELDWVSETGFYVPEGPTYDNRGNLYFSPLFPREDVSLISLDLETGERNWSVPGDGHNAGSGAILILNDPDTPGEQLIYHASYEKAMAIRPDGTVLWETATGLSVPEVVSPGERSQAHSYGLNYHPSTDSVVGLTTSAAMFAFDRVTGEMVAPLGRVPGVPAVVRDLNLPDFVIQASNMLTDEVFGTIPGGASLWETIVNTILGGGAVVTNFFAIDPNSSRIYVAATGEDADDGTEDGQSELGAIYALDLVDDGSGGLEFQVLGRATFDGGTGSTPSISEDGRRVYVSDDLGNVIAYDRDLNELWRFDLGSQVVASVAVSPDNRELYAVTRQDVFKLVDGGDSATLGWIATLEAFADDPDIEVVFQALTPTITANGIAVSVGGGKLVGENPVLLRVGVGLLDRDTGVLRSFTEGREESIAVTSVTPAGAICTANSPVRHASGNVLFDDLTEDIIGGISCYKPARNDLLVRDATCAAGVRAQNAATIASSAPASADRDIRQIEVLIDQSRRALERALIDGDLGGTDAAELLERLDAAETNVRSGELRAAGNELVSICRDTLPPTN